jgi:hypothetical protein
VLIAPTNSCLGRLESERISRLDRAWRQVSGDPPSKEVVMHRACLEARPEAGAVVHLHSTHATAIACLAAPGETAPIPPLTPYFVMRVGRTLPVVPYDRPGDPAMEPAIAEAARRAKAARLAPLLRAAGARVAISRFPEDDRLMADPSAAPGAPPDRTAPAAHPIAPLLASRWSPRSFLDREVPEPVLRRVLEAARWAPSCYNAQPWHYVIARRHREPEAFAPPCSTASPRATAPGARVRRC